jgi:hypothetical protein
MLLKNTLRWPTLFAALLLARAQDVTPPVPIRQIEPEWGADLAKGYLEDRTQVAMIVDAEGIPFSLKGPCPTTS